VAGNTRSALYTCQGKESTIDFDGHISLLFFTKGCNFRCGYCHNPGLITSDGENMPWDELASILEKGRKNWIDGVCITGGEPTMQKNLPETVSFIKDMGFDVKLDTQGSFPEIFEKTIPFCDYIAMDYKTAINEYPGVTGVNVDRIKIQKSLELLISGSVDYELRTTVVPGIHTEDVIRRICTELQGVKRFVLQGFMPRDDLRDESLRVTGKTPADMLENYADICRGHFSEVIVR